MQSLCKPCEIFAPLIVPAFSSVLNIEQAMLQLWNFNMGRRNHFEVSKFSKTQYVI